ncbi:MAG: S8 family serine peptidase [Candidatus Cloacimonetes bacterium]|nr:S8 family serine peptidase [Candidatus Cloacimonadota bacterium]
MKITLLILLVVFSQLVFAINSNILTADLSKEMDNNRDNKFIRINISLEENYSYEDLYIQTKDLSNSDKRERVTSILQNYTKSEQSEIIEFLNEFENQGLVKEIKSIWINNIITCYAKNIAIQELTKFQNIKSIDHDEYRKMIFTSKNSSIDNQDRDREITWNVTKVNGDDVWQLGFQGEGVVVAVLDTGVNYNHNDLNDHLWTDVSYPNHGYDFVNNDNNPMDDHGHGTHCAGTVAGDGTSGSQTGVAPEAQIMALKILASDGSGTESGVWEAIQFAIDNGANVLSMSIGWQHDWNPNRVAWRNAMDGALTAGLVASVAAGNEGDYQSYYPIPDNVRTPGDCPPPWLHPDQTLTGGISSVICVGATNSYDEVTGFSSRGPITWEDINPFNDYPYQPEMGLIRPDVCAPGANIKSLAHYSDTAYENGWDGTSMATPLNAGVIALMLSKNINLSPAEIDQILEETAEHFTTNKNNNSGSGRIDALAAINAVSIPETPPEAVVSPIPENNSMGVSTSVTLAWQNGSGGFPDYYKVYLGTDNPPTNILNGIDITENSYNVTEYMDIITQYYWKIEAHNAYGSSESDVWTFTTSSSISEDFETGDFSQYNWTFAGQEDWIIAENTAYTGVYAAQSGDISGYQSSSLILNIDVAETGFLTFWKKVSSELDDDWLRLYVDDELVSEWSGEIDWSQESIDLHIGHHEIKWKYKKYSNDVSGDDKVWIDAITFPILGEFDPAQMDIDVSEIDVEANTTDVLESIFNISNTGGETLVYDLVIEYISEATEWLSLDVSSGEIYGGEFEEIQVALIPTELENGNYEANIIVTDNTENEIIIPVNFSVQLSSVDNTPVIIENSISNYPNPFNPSTTISFSLTTESTEHTELIIYNLKGQKIKKFEISPESIREKFGINKVIWNGKDENNNAMPSGIYLYKIISGKFTSTKKMILMK